jgi:phosphatidylglycerophosphatase A
MKSIIRFLATGCYTGEMPIIPGTWGTLPGLALAIFVFGVDVQYQVLITVGMIAVSVILASAAEKDLGHDAKPIVIDEVAGMLVTLVFVPRVWYYYILGFVLFRAMDVLKPFPARKFELLPSGWGVTADDVAAGVYANILLQVIVHFTKNL